ncbi:hypothetical protein BaRGS_00040420 [Batillaria attramentaria]|uniref:Uncharacterized protein n=1 Tax=Batillaria attramentaria TaxID=370345 RepID=A0ABD0J0E5_9CAEN
MYWILGLVLLFLWGLARMWPALSAGEGENGEKHQNSAALTENYSDIATDLTTDVEPENQETAVQPEQSGADCTDMDLAQLGVQQAGNEDEQTNITTCTGIAHTEENTAEEIEDSNIDPAQSEAQGEEVETQSNRTSDTESTEAKNFAFHDEQLEEELATGAEDETFLRATPENEADDAGANNMQQDTNWTRRDNFNLCINKATVVNINSPTTPTDENSRVFARLAWDEIPEMKKIKEELERLKRENEELNSRQAATAEREARAAQENEQLLAAVEKLRIDKEREALLAHQQGSAEVDKLKKQLDQQKKNQNELKERIKLLHTTVSSNSDQATKNAEERARLIRLVQQFADERAATEKKLNDLRLQHESERKALSQRFEETLEKEHEQVSTFVVRLEERDKQILQEVVTKLQNGRQLADVAERLDKDYNVRLLGVDCGLGFVMKASGGQWQNMQDKQAEIQNILKQLLPSEMREDAKFREMTPSSAQDDDVELGQPLSGPPDDILQTEQSTECNTSVPGVGAGVQATRNSAENGASSTMQSHESPGGEAAASAGGRTHLGPMKSKVKRIFAVTPRPPKDSGAGSRAAATSSSDTIIILSLASTDAGRIYMADMTKYALMYITVNKPTVVKSVDLTTTPMFISVLRNNEVAITSVKGDSILLVNVEELNLKLIKTEKKYSVVAQGNEDTLIAGRWKEDSEPAGIDVISMRGDLVRTICDGNTITALCKPQSLCVVGDVVLVAEKPSDAILRINLSTGTLLAKHTHPSLSKPVGVTSDREGNIYIASSGDRSVLVMSVDGRWRRLLTGEKHGECSFDTPTGIALTKGGLVVSWMRDDNRKSIVIGYHLA